MIASHFTLRHAEIRQWYASDSSRIEGTRLVMYHSHLYFSFSIKEWSETEPRIKNWSRNRNTYYLDPHSMQPVQNAALVKGEDLLAAYDQGIELIRGWNLDDP